MKTRILLSVFMLLAYASISFSQSNTDDHTNDLAVEQRVHKTDSVYYGCVPCCQDCSVFTTDKPGECPHCGMTLEKRIYKADLVENKNLVHIDNPACKPPKEKRKRK